MNALPRPDIRYRIQSDDFDTFLELYDAKDSSIVPRLAQRDSLLQQWIFVPSGTGYNILNAATKSLPLPRYLTLPPMSSHLGAGQAEAITKPVKAWNVKMVEGGTFSLSLPIPGLEECEIFLVMNGFYGEPNSEKVRVPSIENQPRRRRWRISEVDLAIPDGRYYIRLFDGKALHCNRVTNFQISIAALDLKDDNRAFVWEVQNLGNGKCTIKNLTGEVYLGCDPSTAKRQPDLAAKRIMRDDLSDVKAKDPLSLTYSNQGEVVLMPIKRAANATAWIFEATDRDAYDLDPRGRRSAANYGARFPEILGDREYYIENAGSGLRIGYVNDPWRFSPRGNPFGIQLYFEYQDDSACFFLSAPDYNTYYSFNLDGNTVVANAFIKTLWHLEREIDPAGGFLYKICLSSNPEMVLDGDLQIGVNKYESYVVVEKAKGKLSQLWKLTEPVGVPA